MSYVNNGCFLELPDSDRLHPLTSTWCTLGAVTLLHVVIGTPICLRGVTKPQMFLSPVSGPRPLILSPTQALTHLDMKAIRRTFDEYWLLRGHTYGNDAAFFCARLVSDLPTEPRFKYRLLVDP